MQRPTRSRPGRTALPAMKYNDERAEEGERRQAPRHHGARPLHPVRGRRNKLSPDADVFNANTSLKTTPFVPYEHVSQNCNFRSVRTRLSKLHLSFRAQHPLGRLLRTNRFTFQPTAGAAHSNSPLREASARAR